MPTDYHHGVRVVELSDGRRPIRTIETAIIGLVATAADADAAFFPLNTPVLVTDVNAAIGQQNVITYSIALASPLPRIDFPIGGGKITLLPFAKTASGTFGDGTRKPTNTIVDFYVESIANLPGQPSDATINGGRAYAVFRINYEDVEQGNDHDMDAIVRYLIVANADGTVTVSLSSEYAAGSADQNICVGVASRPLSPWMSKKRSAKALRLRRRKSARSLRVPLCSAGIMVRGLQLVLRST